MTEVNIPIWGRLGAAAPGAAGWTHEEHFEVQIVDPDTDLPVPAGQVGEIVVRAKAAAGDAKQVGAPMPGVISSLAVKVGQKVTAGDVLCSIEAMKMETAIHADADGVVAEVTIKPGDQIDAKDLLVRFE